MGKTRPRSLLSKHASEYEENKNLTEQPRSMDENSV